MRLRLNGRSSKTAIKLLPTLEGNSTAQDDTRGIGNVLGTIAGGVGQFLSLMTWFVMKNRSGTVGRAWPPPCGRCTKVARISESIWSVTASVDD